MEFIHNGVDPGASSTDAGTDGIDFLVVGPDRHFGTAASLTSDGTNFHHAVVDFRHFHLEQTANQTVVGSGNQHLSTPGTAANLHHVDLDAVSLPIAFPRYLFFCSQQCFRTLPARADFHMEGTAAGIGTRDNTGKQFLGFSRELIVYHVPFCFPNALDDYLAGSLGSDAAKILRL